MEVDLFDALTDGELILRFALRDTFITLKFEILQDRIDICLKMFCLKCFTLNIFFIN